MSSISARGLVRQGLGLVAFAALAGGAASAHAQLVTRTSPLTRTEVVEKFSIGDGHGCFINNCGELRCWGESSYSETSAPSGVFIEVAAGRDHTCALDSAGNPRCWGDSRWGQTQHPAGPFVQLSAGALHTCGLRSNGSVACWGQLSSPQLSGAAIHLSSGRYHACAVVDTASDRRIECWGSDSYGEASPPSPTQIPLYLGAHAETSGGGYHTCSLTDQGLLQCFGYDGYRQVSGQHPTFPSSPFATDQGGFWDFPLRWTQVSAGGYHTCALRDTSDPDNVMCWGYGAFGQTTPPSGRFEQVDAGDYFTCGLRNGALACWGMASSGRTAPPALGTCELQLVARVPRSGFQLNL